jgi:hypothetical protein
MNYFVRIIRATEAVAIQRTFLSFFQFYTQPVRFCRLNINHMMGKGSCIVMKARQMYTPTRPRRRRLGGDYDKEQDRQELTHTQK